MNFEERRRLREERSELLRAVAPYVGNGERSASRRVAALGSDLTRREREVLLGAIAGMTYSETSSWLGIGETTVKHYSQTMMAKLGAKTIAHAVAITYEHHSNSLVEVSA